LDSLERSCLFGLLVTFKQPDISECVCPWRAYQAWFIILDKAISLP